MLLDKKSEKEFRKGRGIEALGKYDALILRLGLKLEWLPGFPPAEPQSYGLESFAGAKLYRGRRGGKEILFTSAMMGASAASFDIEAYLCHSPAVEGIGLGYCGALQPGIEIGTIIIPDRAAIGEGTSRYYEKHGVSCPDPDLVRRLAEAARRCGYEPLVGEVFSTDGVFMETPELLGDLARRGIIGIDMEMSALFSIAEYHGKRAAGILVVSDKPYEGPLHSLSIPFRKTEAISDDALKICIQALAP